MAEALRYTFCDLAVDLKYAQGVLMPSPFSRLLAVTLCKALRSCAHSSKRALDIGSGSGVQAILLAKLGVPEVYAVDIDSRSVAATEFNALLNDVSEWRHSSPAVYAHLGDLFEPVTDLTFDWIVSNPPTMPAGDDTPKFATGGSYPLQVLDRLIEGVARLLAPGGRFIFTVSSLAGLARTMGKLTVAGLDGRVLETEVIPFRDFYYPHIAYYRRLRLQGIAEFDVLQNGELSERVHVIEATHKS